MEGHSAQNTWPEHSECYGDITPTIRSGLESFSKKFKKATADQRGDHSDFKIGNGENISEGPNYTPLLPHARTLKLSNQEIRVQQEDDKAYLDHRSPDTFHHGRCRLLEPRLYPGKG